VNKGQKCAPTRCVPPLSQATTRGCRRPTVVSRARRCRLAVEPGSSSQRRPEPSRRRNHPATGSGAHPATPGRPRRTPFLGTLTKTGTGPSKRRCDRQVADLRRTAARGQARPPSRGNADATPVVSRGIGYPRFFLAPISRGAINRCLSVTFTWAPQLPGNNTLHGTATIDLQPHLQPQRTEY